MTTTNKPVLAQAESVVQKTAAERNKLHIRLMQLNDEIAYLQSEIASGNESLQETLNERVAEKVTVDTELKQRNDAFLSELKSMRDDLLRERLAVLKSGKDRQEGLASEIKRTKVEYLKKVMALKELADDTFADVSSYDEIMTYVGQNPVDITTMIAYPYPLVNGDNRYSPYVTPQEIGAAYDGTLPYPTRSYEQNYMRKAY
ncbi:MULTISPECIES: hypothetical protein [Bacillus cereus group]|uniref:Uncharacterized protein n=2 Tax=Bacillus cereus group TaxID=86661 RepID=A0A2A7DB06_BACAN|nr:MULTISPECIES: hypothetical protein [Bacillus cereus group]PDZ17095.1 hypothetical protein CON16_10465 [Bacillus anthracis]PEJ50092.1 hypothetical protein CN676_16730 [Bacillus wiedmannii]PEN47078.1 hypothetical protein CN630_12965 [Bacillus wiedmannii]PEO59313.1 hypothetical protein CN560_10150 [Bacillus wiedmannii]PEP02129.1 hypothetical protein CN554_00015 [Bacillus wiedmannii]